MIMHISYSFVQKEFVILEQLGSKEARQRCDYGIAVQVRKI